MIALPPTIPTANPEVAALVYEIRKSVGDDAARSARAIGIAHALVRVDKRAEFREAVSEFVPSPYEWGCCAACTNGRIRFPPPAKKKTAAPASRFEALALEMAADVEPEPAPEAWCVRCYGTGWFCMPSVRRKAEDRRASINGLPDGWVAEQKRRPGPTGKTAGTYTPDAPEAVDPFTREKMWEVFRTLTDGVVDRAAAAAGMEEEALRMFQAATTKAIRENTPYLDWTQIKASQRAAEQVKAFGRPPSGFAPLVGESVTFEGPGGVVIVTVIALITNGEIGVEVVAGGFKEMVRMHMGASSEISATRYCYDGRFADGRLVVVEFRDRKPFQIDVEDPEKGEFVGANTTSGYLRGRKVW